MTQKFIASDSAIQALVIGNLDKTKKISANLKDEGFDVRPILAPTVPNGAEAFLYPELQYKGRYRGSFYYNQENNT